MRSLIVIAAMLAAIWSSPATAIGNSIGSIKTVAGKAEIVRCETRLPATLGAQVFQDDILETAGDGSLGVTFRDETMMSIGPGTQIRLDKYAFAPEEEKYSLVTRITRGTLFYVSGLIAKLSPQSTAIVTPGGTIGVRGTRFVVRVRES